LYYNKIKILAGENKISLKDLAEKIGLSEQGLHSGIKKQTLSVTNLERIAELLGVPVSYFFEDKEYTDKVEENAVVYGKKTADVHELEIELAVALTRIEELRGQVEYFRKLYEKVMEEKNKPDTKQ
jgi:transcriptional regulator with XRE-family HTH domain